MPAGCTVMHNVTPYDGWSVVGKIKFTIARGRVLLVQGIFADQPPAGRMVRLWFKGRYRFDRVVGPRLASAIRGAAPICEPRLIRGNGDMNLSQEGDPSSTWAARTASNSVGHRQGPGISGIGLQSCIVA